MLVVPDDRGPVATDDGGRSWPTLGEALVELVAEGWRIVGATREAGRERSRLRRPRP